MTSMTDKGTSDTGANSMWGGRFAAGPDAIMEAINASIGFDQRLAAQDIRGSRAHAAMLAVTGIISDTDAQAIGEGLLTVLSEIEGGDFVFSTALEDIHMNVEARLAELIGPAAGRLHTARSRNDQVATDFRLYVRDTIDETNAALAAFQRALVTRALEHAGTVMPGFTHLQTAQPVTFGHHLLAYVEMAGRDRGRFIDARKRLNESPLGAAALAGTSFPIDRAATAKALIPAALSIGVGPLTALAAFAAVSALFVLPTYPTLLAAVEMDDTGSTRIGKYVFNHPFLVPGVVCVAVSVILGYAIGAAVV